MPKPKRPNPACAIATAASTRAGATTPRRSRPIWRAHALLPDRVLVSSALRTRETWERMATAFSPAPPAGYEDRLYESGTEAILAAIRATDRSASALLVIGHNPGLHDTARTPARASRATRHALDDGLPTAGLVVIDFAENDWRRLAARSGRLAAFVTPRLLKTEKD